MTEQHLSSVIVNPTGKDDSLIEIKTSYSDISFNRYGLKKRVIQANFIHDYGTVVRVAKNIIRRKSLGVMTIDCIAALSYGNLDIGDVIQITSEDFHLTEHKAQIIEKKYEQNYWRFTIVLEDNPVHNN